MNIFLLHENPTICAEMHCDKHVVKMVIEYAQLMSTAHRVLDGDLYEDRTAAGRRIKRWLHPNTQMENTLYKASHINHPDGIWTRNSDANYRYLYNLWTRLCEEYTHRYGREHLTETKLVLHILAATFKLRSLKILQGKKLFFNIFTSMQKSSPHKISNMCHFLTAFSPLESDKSQLSNRF